MTQILIKIIDAGDGKVEIETSDSSNKTSESEFIIKYKIEKFLHDMIYGELYGEAKEICEGIGKNES